jgi:hypothetical protein
MFPSRARVNFSHPPVMMLQDTLVIAGIIAWILGIGLLLSIQQESSTEERVPAIRPGAPPPQKLIDIRTLPTNNDFVPVQDRIVPTHSYHSNKFNDVIGNQDSEWVAPAAPEVVVPSDWYMKRTLPTEFDGPYWPKGTILPDFIYPGSDPMRPLRHQDWPSSYASVPGA